MEPDGYHATIKPDGVSGAFKGDPITLMCSTNLPATIARWEIGGNSYAATHLPPGFTTDGLNLTFILEKRVKIRCFFTIITGESICSPEAFVIPHDIRG